MPRSLGTREASSYRIRLICSSMNAGQGSQVFRLRTPYGQSR
jgi:hypothetical protein